MLDRVRQAHRRSEWILWPIGRRRQFAAALFNLARGAFGLGLLDRALPLGAAMARAGLGGRLSGRLF